jgi:hypothetical protein
VHRNYGAADGLVVFRRNASQVENAMPVLDPGDDRWSSGTEGDRENLRELDGPSWQYEVGSAAATDNAGRRDRTSAYAVTDQRCGE